MSARPGGVPVEQAPYPVARALGEALAVSEVAEAVFDRACADAGCVLVVGR